MAKQTLERVRLQVLYRGKGPHIWSGGTADFGVQDKDGVLHLGEVGAEESVRFDLWLDVKPQDTGAPVFLGPFAHGPPSARFIYLSWRNHTGEYAQRLLLPLSSITWRDIRTAQDKDQPLRGELIDLQPKKTTTGVNIGGRRSIVWEPPARQRAL